MNQNVKNCILIGVIVLSLFLIAGCGRTADELAKACHDNVTFLVSSAMDDSLVCYDSRGLIQLIFMNGNGLPIESFNYTVTATKKQRTGKILAHLNPYKSMSVQMNFKLSEIGKIKRIDIYPNVVWKDSIKSCKYNKVVFRNVIECVGEDYG